MNRVMMSQSGVGRLESMTGWPPIFAWVNSSRVNRSRQSHLRRPVCRRYTETSPCHLPRIYKCPARSIIYLGMDVHKESITIAVLPEGVSTKAVQEPLSGSAFLDSGGITWLSLYHDVRRCVVNEIDLSTKDRACR